MWTTPKIQLQHHWYSICADLMHRRSLFRENVHNCIRINRINGHMGNICMGLHANTFYRWTFLLSNRMETLQQKLPHLNLLLFSCFLMQQLLIFVTRCFRHTFPEHIFFEVYSQSEKKCTFGFDWFPLKHFSNSALHIYIHHTEIFTFLFRHWQLHSSFDWAVTGLTLTSNINNRFQMNFWWNGWNVCVSHLGLQPFWYCTFL